MGVEVRGLHLVSSSIGVHFSEKTLSLNPELTNPGSLANQLALGILSPLQRWIYRQAAVWVLRIHTSAGTSNPLPTEPSSLPTPPHPTSSFEQFLPFKGSKMLQAYLALSLQQAWSQTVL